jgi:hypothetical protein
MSSMRGSGIYSETVTREIVCEELCWDCQDAKRVCPQVFERDFETDDWGNIEQTVECKKCLHEYTYKEEKA